MNILEANSQAQAYCEVCRQFIHAVPHICFGVIGSLTTIEAADEIDRLERELQLARSDADSAVANCDGWREKYDDANEEIKSLERERDDLRKALELLAVLGEQGMQPDYQRWLTFHDKVSEIARAALAKAVQ